jgi:hypothetical protein
MKKKRVLILSIVLVSLISIVGYAANGNDIVYITKTGEKYHTARCMFVSKSKIAISLREAVSRGFTPCKRCKPPSLD